MDVKFNCPICHKLLALDESCIGRKVQCPFCNNVFTMEPLLSRHEVDRGGKTEAESEKGCLKRCPVCGEMIQRQARKCRYCGEYLNADERHVVVSGPCGERLYSKSTYNNSEPPVVVPNESHVSICFLLGFFLGLSIVGILLAYLIGGKNGLVASIKGALFSVLVVMVAFILLVFLGT